MSGIREVCECEATPNARRASDWEYAIPTLVLATSVRLTARDARWCVTRDAMGTAKVVTTVRRDATPRHATQWHRHCYLFRKRILRRRLMKYISRRWWRISAIAKLSFFSRHLFTGIELKRAVPINWNNNWYGVVNRRQYRLRESNKCWEN